MARFASLNYFLKWVFLQCNIAAGAGAQTKVLFAKQNIYAVF
jgi:hypothetical protein